LIRVGSHALDVGDAQDCRWRCLALEFGRSVKARAVSGVGSGKSEGVCLFERACGGSRGKLR
jgi:hypothetical protein